jgi:hypothetical protein
VRCSPRKADRPPGRLGGRFVWDEGASRYASTKSATPDCRVANVTEALIEQLRARFVLERMAVEATRRPSRPGQAAAAINRAPQPSDSPNARATRSQTRPRAAPLGAGLCITGLRRRDETGIGGHRVSLCTPSPDVCASAGFVATQRPIAEMDCARVNRDDSMAVRRAPILIPNLRKQLRPRSRAALFAGHCDLRPAGHDPKGNVRPVA